MDFVPMIVDVRRGSRVTTVCSYGTADYGCIVQLGPIIGDEDPAIAQELQHVFEEQGWVFVCRLGDEGTKQ